MKELEKQRIEKIKSLDNDQIMNYVDVIIDDVCELHDFHSVINPDERINEITDLYNKLNEVSDLTDDEYNVMPYIKSNLDTDLLIVYTVNAVKDIVDYANLKNYLISLLIKDIFNGYVNLQFHLILFHGMFKKLNLISETADVNVVNEIKKISIAEFKKIFPKLVNDLNSNIEKIDELFYPDDVLIDDIQDMKKTLSEISASDNDYNMKLKKYGIIKSYSGLINAYIHQMELKKLFDKYKSDIVDLIESDNAFYNLSASDFEILSDVDFDEFMKSEMKFNLSKCKLWK